MSNSQLQQNIMRRVYIVRSVRRVLFPLALKLYAVVALAAFGLTYISPAHVLANSAHLSSPAAYLKFFTNAFTHTELIVQIVLVALALAAFWSIRDMVRTFTGYGRYAQRTA